MQRQQVNLILLLFQPETRAFVLDLVGSRRVLGQEVDVGWIVIIDVGIVARTTELKRGWLFVITFRVMDRIVIIGRFLPIISFRIIDWINENGCGNWLLPSMGFVLGGNLSKLIFLACIRHILYFIYYVSFILHNMNILDILFAVLFGFAAKSDSMVEIRCFL